MRLSECQHESKPMKKAFTLLLPLLLSAFYVTIPASAQAPPPPPPPANDYFPDKWNEYTSEGGKFRIRFPKEPQKSVSKQGQFDVHSMALSGLLHYRISYVDYKTPLDDPQKVSGLLQGIKQAALSSLQGKEFRMVAEREITVDGHKGASIHIEVEGKEVVHMQWVVAGSVLYSIATSSRKGRPNELEGKDDFAKIVSGFISSFHVTQ